jgi:protein-tyrosine-phosphatase
MLGAADVVFVMDYANHATLLSRYPQFSRKTFLLGELRAGGKSVEIPDPYDGTVDDVRACYRDLALCTDHLINLIGDTAGTSGFREPVIPASQIPQRREAQ